MDKPLIEKEQLQKFLNDWLRERAFASVQLIEDHDPYNDTWTDDYIVVYETTLECAIPGSLGVQIDLTTEGWIGVRVGSRKNLSQMTHIKFFSPHVILWGFEVGALLLDDLELILNSVASGDYNIVYRKTPGFNASNAWMKFDQAYDSELRKLKSLKPASWILDRWPRGLYVRDVRGVGWK